MAYKCDNCGKGKKTGHMVSHAKNRLARLFKPNLQKLKVLRNGIIVRVKFCTSCIKRLRKDGRVNSYSLIQLSTVKAPAALPVAEVLKSVEKELKASAQGRSASGGKEKVKKARETLDIAAIVGTKK